MPTDVSGFDPGSVSMRDHVDNLTHQLEIIRAGHSDRHDRENQVTASIVERHEERHGREHIAHDDLHEAQSGVLRDLIQRLSVQRREDAESVDRALQAVERAAVIHRLECTGSSTTHTNASTKSRRSRWTKQPSKSICVC